MENKTDLRTRVDAALDTVRPHLKADGGDIEIVSIDEDNNLLVRWLGACSHCNMSVMTMRAGIEAAISSQVPEIKSIKAENGLA